MTIAAGFICKQGILICADREESSGASKKVVEKVITLHADPWNMTVATAGSSAAADLALKRLKTAFFQYFCSNMLSLSKLEANHEQIIIDVLTKVHEEHVWKNQAVDHSFRLVIGLSFLELHQCYLYVTQDNIPQPINDYGCVGAGDDLCTYFAERLYKRELTKDEMILLAAFIFREVNAARQYCGKGTDMVLLRPGELGFHIYSAGVDAIQKEIPEFSKVTEKFWNSMKALPEWLTTIGRASTIEGAIPVYRREMQVNEQTITPLISRKLKRAQ